MKNEVYKDETSPVPKKPIPTTNDYKKGTYKVAWVGKDPKELFSQMFKDKEKALEFAKTKEDAMVFVLFMNKDDSYGWTLLPSKTTTQFTTAIRLKRGLGVADKSQAVRLADVFFIAPFMMYYGFKAKGIHPLAKYTMIGLGVATLVYNGRNYLKNT